MTSSTNQPRRYTVIENTPHSDTLIVVRIGGRAFNLPAGESAAIEFASYAKAYAKSQNHAKALVPVDPETPIPIEYRDAVWEDGTCKLVDERRNFDAKQKRLMQIRAGGRCEECGVEVGSLRNGKNPWEAHHIKYWIDGGATELANAMVLCKCCHVLLHFEDRHAGSARLEEVPAILEKLRPSGTLCRKWFRARVRRMSTLSELEQWIDRHGESYPPADHIRLMATLERQRELARQRNQKRRDALRRAHARNHQVEAKER